MENIEKIVDFSNCITCKWYPLSEYDEPCHECLNNPTNTNSRIPLNYEKAEKKEKKEDKDK